MSFNKDLDDENFTLKHFFKEINRFYLYTCAMHKRWSLIPILLILLVSSSYGAYYSTLPKGVRALVLKQVSTTKINSSFTGNKQEKEYFFKINIDAPSIQSMTDILDPYLDPLKQKAPEAYNALQLGEFEIDANAKVNVRALGVAYGLTDHLTAYMSLPFYKANVNLNMVRTKGNNNQLVQSIVNENISSETDVDAISTLVQGATNSLPDISGGNIQSIVMNYLGYLPIGNWEAKGMGDIEIGLMKKWTNWEHAGIGSTFGLVLPTGKIDDPDIIQDIPFGDGQFDLFAEVGAATTLFDSPFSIEAFARFTYQAPSQKTMRIPESENYLLGIQKATFEEKLGNFIDITTSTIFQVNSWISLSASYLFHQTFKSNYQSMYYNANRVLEINTDKESHIGKLSLGITTVNLFKKQSFPIPLLLSFSGQKVLNGKNMPKYSMADLELRLFF